MSLFCCKLLEDSKFFVVPHPSEEGVGGLVEAVPEEAGGPVRIHQEVSIVGQRGGDVFHLG